MIFLVLNIILNLRGFSLQPQLVKNNHALLFLLLISLTRSEHFALNMTSVHIDLFVELDTIKFNQCFKKDRQEGGGNA